MTTIKKTILSSVIASALAIMLVSDAVAATSPFTGAKSATSSNVIAGSLDELTPKNTVTTVNTIAEVAPTQSSSQMPSPSSASFGVVTAFDNPNMSQSVADCPPPPTPSCACGSNPPTWSGWDQVSGGVCLDSNTGGWYPGSCDPCPPPPASSASSGGGGTGGGGGGQGSQLFGPGIAVGGVALSCSTNGTCTVRSGDLQSNGKVIPVYQTTTLQQLENGGFTSIYGSHVSVSGNGSSVTGSALGKTSTVSAQNNKLISGASSTALGQALAAGATTQAEKNTINQISSGVQNIFNNGNGNSTASSLTADSWG